MADPGADTSIRSASNSLSISKFPMRSSIFSTAEKKVNIIHIPPPTWKKITLCTSGLIMTVKHSCNLHA